MGPRIPRSNGCVTCKKRRVKCGQSVNTTCARYMRLTKEQMKRDLSAGVAVPATISVRATRANPNFQSSSIRLSQISRHPRTRELALQQLGPVLAGTHRSRLSTRGQECNSTSRRIQTAPIRRMCGSHIWHTGFSPARFTPRSWAPGFTR